MENKQKNLTPTKTIDEEEKIPAKNNEILLVRNDTPIPKQKNIIT